MIRERRYYCYMVRCCDGSFYTGWTLDPERRVKQHNRGTGAAYTRLHRPVELVYVEETASRSAALKREIALKRYSHEKKEIMARSYLNAVAARRSEEHETANAFDA